MESLLKNGLRLRCGLLGAWLEIIIVDHQQIIENYISDNSNSNHDSSPSSYITSRPPRNSIGREHRRSRFAEDGEDIYDDNDLMMMRSNVFRYSYEEREVIGHSRTIDSNTSVENISMNKKTRQIRRRNTDSNIRVRRFQAQTLKFEGQDFDQRNYEKHGSFDILPLGDQENIHEDEGEYISTPVVNKLKNPSKMEFDASQNPNPFDKLVDSNDYAQVTYLENATEIFEKSEFGPNLLQQESIQSDSMQINRDILDQSEVMETETNLNILEDVEEIQEAQC